MLHDEVRGFIGHRYVFTRAGTYEGEATVLAQYLIGPWGTNEQSVDDEATRSGMIRVTVA